VTTQFRTHDAGPMPVRVALVAATRLGFDVVERFVHDALPGGYVTAWIPAGPQDADLVVLSLCWDDRPPAELLDSIQAICQRCAGVPVVAVAPANASSLHRRIFDQGCSGVLSTDLSPEKAAASLNLILTGVVCAPPARVEGKPDISHLTAFKLSQREREVLGLMMKGMSNRTIAARLAISEHTVMVHVRHLLQKLGVANRTQAVYRVTSAEGRGATV
jgi:two-component system, NarL family, nitrate/nitrite response regulator NarL